LFDIGTNLILVDTLNGPAERVSERQLPGGWVYLARLR